MAKSLLVLTALAVLILALAEAKQISFKDCGSMNGKVISVEITPCDQEPCIFKRGEQVLVEVDFTTTLNGSKTAVLTAFATILGEKLQLGLTQPNACKLPGTTCPLIPNVLEKPAEIVNVPTDIPAIFFPIPLQVILTGDDEQNIFCGEVQVKIK